MWDEQQQSSPPTPEPASSQLPAPKISTSAGLSAPTSHSTTATTTSTAAFRRLWTLGVNIYLDTSGKADLDLAIQLLSRGGRVIVMAGLDQRPQLPIGALYTRDAHILGFAISNANTHELAQAAQRINQLLLDGSLQAHNIEELPLSAAAQAHMRLENGTARGTRIILRP